MIRVPGSLFRVPGSGSRNTMFRDWRPATGSRTLHWSLGSLQKLPATQLTRQKGLKTPLLMPPHETGLTQDYGVNLYEQVRSENRKWDTPSLKTMFLCALWKQHGGLPINKGCHISLSMCMRGQQLYITIIVGKEHTNMQYTHKGIWTHFVSKTKMWQMSYYLDVQSKWDVSGSPGL
jgi:hypothetical protein